MPKGTRSPPWPGLQVDRKGSLAIRASMTCTVMLAWAVVEPLKDLLNLTSGGGDAPCDSKSKG